MSIRYRLLAAILLGVSAHAQDALTTNVRGVVVTGDNKQIYGYFVQLSNLSTRVSIDRIEVASDGGFFARQVPLGDYVARVTTFHGEPIAQQFLTINQHTMSIELRLPARRPSPTGTTVSARELLHPLPRQAVEAAVAGQRFADSGKFDRAAAELEKAVRISPAFAEAHLGLAVQYLRLGRFAEAAEEALAALNLKKDLPGARYVLRMSLAALGK